MIRKRGQSWLVEVYDPGRGRAVHVRAGDYGLPIPRTKREALELERRALTAKTGPLTIREFASRWPNDYPAGSKGHRRGESTLKHYRDQVKQFVDLYGDTPLRAFTREDARAWGLLHRGQARSVSVMFSDALSDDLIEANPFQGMSFGTVGRKHVDPPGIEDVRRLARGDDAPLMWWMFTTGMRVGEVCAAKWENLDGTRYHVREQWNQRLRCVTDCKHGSNGWVHVPSFVIAMLPRQTSEFIFPTTTGRMMTTGTFTYRWHRIRAAAGFPDMPAHMLRHACAAHLLNVLGVEPWKIAKQLRHSDGGKLVVELYGHPDVDVALDGIAAAYTDGDVSKRAASTDSATDIPWEAV